jgi:hypothetical protein
VSDARLLSMQKLPFLVEWKQYFQMAALRP